METKVPDGWWKLEGLHGTRAAVIKIIGQTGTVPKEWQAAIIAEINRLEPKFNMVTVHAHFHVEKGQSSLHLAIKPSEALI